MPMRNLYKAKRLNFLVCNEDMGLERLELMKIIEVELR